MPSSPSAGAGRDPGAIDVGGAGNAGAGTLRAAIEAANRDRCVTLIRVRPALPAIGLRSPLLFTGPQHLTIEGGGATLDAKALPAPGARPVDRGALVAIGGGSLTIRDLTIRGAPGVGLLVDVPHDWSGEVALVLERVTVEECRLHGVLVNDQAAYFTDHETRESAGSPAGVRIEVRACRLVRNGWGDLDNDGLRVNEGGDGSLAVTILDTVADENGGEGIELDERGPGDAVVVVERSSASRNGALTAEDLDDGIDVDETGPGNIDARFIDVRAAGNAQQGIELNENNAGDLRVEMRRVTADDNGAEGIEVEEDDHAGKNPGEAWGGSLIARLTDVSTSRNGSADGDADAGLELRENAAGNLTADLVRPAASGNAVSGIRVRERGAGSVDARAEGGTVTENRGDGVRLDGTGRAALDGVKTAGNAGSDVTADESIDVDRCP